MKFLIKVLVDADNQNEADWLHEEMKGAIEKARVTSKIGDGLTFEVFDPIKVGGPTDPNDLAAINAAKEQHVSEGTLEVDDNAVVSFSTDGGAYVQAWVWVDNSSIAAKGGVNPETAENEDVDD